MIFETHAHYDDDRFLEDKETILRELLPKAGISHVVNIASDMKSVFTTDELTKNFEYVYGALGVHPSDIEELTEEDMQTIRSLAEKNPKIRAIGEIGFDYSEGYPDKTLQEKWFRRQILLADELSLPIVVHSRDAAEDTYRVIRDCYEGKDGAPHGIIHCFSYSAGEAEKYVRLGFMIGIGGVVTFKNAKKLREVTEKIDLEHIVLETDSPYLSPDPHRGERNTSANLKWIAQKIAELKEVSFEEVCRQTAENAGRLYRIKE